MSCAIQPAMKICGLNLHLLNIFSILQSLWLPKGKEFPAVPSKFIQPIYWWSASQILFGSSSQTCTSFALKRASSFIIYMQIINLFMCIKLIEWEGIDHHYVDTLGAFRHIQSQHQYYKYSLPHKVILHAVLCQC